jgi:hypothetical protein
MPTYEIPAPDGNTYRIDGPAGASSDQVRAKVLEQHPSAGTPRTARPAAPPSPAAAPDSGLGQRLYERSGVKGLVEGADIAASLAGGVAGSIAQGLNAFGGYTEQALGLPGPKDPAATAERAAELFTYQPRTDRGKAVMADVARGLHAFEAWTDRVGAATTEQVLKAGNAAGDVARKLGAPPAVIDFIEQNKIPFAANTGAVVKTGINAIPLALGEEALRGRASAKLPEAARGAKESTAQAPAPQPSADASRAPGASAAPPLTASSVPRESPNLSLEGGAAPTTAPNTPKARAQTYVRDRLGLSWDALADATQRKLETIATQSGALERLNPDAVRRQAHLERDGFGRKPIVTTLGKLERDPVRLDLEEGAAATRSGRSIVEADTQANRDLRANIETLVDRLGGPRQRAGGGAALTRATAKDAEGVGAAVAGKEEGALGALTVKQARAKAATRRAYEEAKKTEPDAKVAPDPMYEFVRGEPDVLNPMTQHIGWLRNWLKRAGIERLDESGEVVGPKRPISAVELDDLRKLAGERAGGTGDAAHYAGKVLGTIDRMFDEGLPASANKWKAARDAHAAERAEFANQGAIARLVETKGGRFGTDPKTALEDVWNVAVKNAKLEEVRELKRSLLSGDAETRIAGKKALRELRAETGKQFLDYITSGTGTNMAGEANITAAQINKWIKSQVGDGTLESGTKKLEVIWGVRNTRELMNILEDAQITKTEPAGLRKAGSNTFSRILNWMDHSGIGGAVKKIPGAGPAVKLGEMAVTKLQEANTIAKAGETATSAAERAARASADARAAAIQAEQIRGRVPPTYQGGP